MPASLSTLTPELLLEICTQLSSKRDLGNLASCSKGLYDNVTPDLYRNLDLNLPGPHSAMPNTKPTENASDRLLRHLIILFVQKPKLASYVRTFSNRPSFGDGPFKDSQSKCEGEPRTTQVLDREIVKAIRLLSHSKAEEQAWVEEAYYQDDALMAVLISRLTRTESLDLEITNDPRRVPLVLKRITRRERPFNHLPEDAFSNLRSALWCGEQEKYGVYPCPALFLIPSMRSVYMYRIGTDGQDVDSPTYLHDLSHGCSNVERIQLSDSRLTNGELSSIVGAPRALKTFIYEVGFGHLSYCEFSLPKLRQILSVHSESLEDLWLDHYIDEYFDEYIDDVPPMATLQEFTRLRRLRIAVIFIFGAFGDEESTEQGPREALSDLLPPQLETLHITRWQDKQRSALLTSLQHLLEQQRDPDILPRLKDVRIEVQREEANAHAETFARVLRLAESVGTKLTLLRGFTERERTQAVLSGTVVEQEWGWDEDVEWRASSIGGHTRPLRTMLRMDDTGGFGEVLF